MLLLIDASRANNEQKTGVEWYAFFVIEELKKIIPRDLQVILYTREPLKGALSNLPPNWSVKVLGWPPRRLWTQIRLSWEIYQMKKQCGSDNLALFIPAHVLPLFTPAKTFITIHDLGGFKFPSGYSWFERWFTKFAVLFAVSRATIFTPSDFSKKEILYYLRLHGKKIADEKIKVIPNAYNKEEYLYNLPEEKISAILTKYKIQAPYFLTIGRLEEKKNTVGLIEAFEIFKSGLERAPANDEKNNFQLALLGKPGFGYDKVAEALKKSAFKKDIILPGWVDQIDVPYLLAGARAFVFPSFYEGFGIPVLEAFAVGTAVIASFAASLPEVAGGAALLVNPNKPMEIAKAFKLVISDVELRQKMIVAGLKRSADFDWSKTASRIFDEIK